MIHERFTVECGGVAVRLATFRRTGALAPVLFLHGFGSTKEDCADAARHPRFAGRVLLALDAPGSGETRCSPDEASMPLYAAAAAALLERHDVRALHLVGHSMGGLAALLLAETIPGRLLSFASIEGNLAPEDCFLSRRIFERPAEPGGEFLDRFVADLRTSSGASLAFYAAGVAGKVQADAVGPMFRSIVALSDEGGLLDRFLALSCPKMLMYGSENRSLSYLGRLAAEGVELCEIPDCGHFPMYTDPRRMWGELGAFIAKAEAGLGHG